MTQWPVSFCLIRSFIKAFLLPNSFMASLLSVGWNRACSWFLMKLCLLVSPALLPLPPPPPAPPPVLPLLEFETRPPPPLGPVPPGPLWLLMEGPSSSFGVPYRLISSPPKWTFPLPPRWFMTDVEEALSWGRNSLSKYASSSMAVTKLSVQVFVFSILILTESWSTPPLHNESLLPRKPPRPSRCNSSADWVWLWQWLWLRLAVPLAAPLFEFWLRAPPPQLSSLAPPARLVLAALAAVAFVSLWASTRWSSVAVADPAPLPSDPRPPNWICCSSL